MSVECPRCHKPRHKREMILRVCAFCVERERVDSLVRAERDEGAAAMSHRCPECQRLSLATPGASRCDKCRARRISPHGVAIVAAMRRTGYNTRRAAWKVTEPTALLIIVAAMLTGCATAALHSEDPVKRACAAQAVPTFVVFPVIAAPVIFGVEDILYARCLHKIRTNL